MRRLALSITAALLTTAVAAIAGTPRCALQRLAADDLISLARLQYACDVYVAADGTVPGAWYLESGIGHVLTALEVRRLLADLRHPRGHAGAAAVYVSTSGSEERLAENISIVVLPTLAGILRVDVLQMRSAQLAAFVNGDGSMSLDRLHAGAHITAGSLYDPRVNSAWALTHVIDWPE